MAADPRRASAPRMAATALVAMGLAFFAACGDDSDTPSGSSGGEKATQPGGPPDLEGTTLTYLGFGGGTVAAFEKTWFKEFQEKTGAKIVIDEPTDYTKVETQVKSGAVQYDLVDGDPYVMDPQCGTVWQELTKVDISAVAPAYRPGSKCTVPDYQYFYVITYDAARYGDNENPKDCKDFFDTERFPGKRAVWSYYVSAIVECAAIAAGADPKNPYPIDIDAAFAKLESIKDELAIYDTSATAVDQMQNHDVAMGIYSANMVSTALDEDAPVGVSDEWFMRAVGSFAIPKGAPNAEAAEALLDYIMRPSVNPTWLPASPGGGGNVTTPLKVEDTQDIIPDDLESGGVIDWDWWAQNDPEVGQRWADTVIG